MNEQFLKRLKSFGWRFLAYMIAIALAWLADNIGLLELNPTLTAIVGLILGECSKLWANYQESLGKSYFGRVKK